VLGYRPTFFHGKWRRIKVRVTSSDSDQRLQAFYKRGYYSLVR
jgi:hypothetical protein